MRSAISLLSVFALLSTLHLGCGAADQGSAEDLSADASPAYEPPAPPINVGNVPQEVPPECEDQYLDCLTRNEAEPCLAELDDCAPPPTPTAPEESRTAPPPSAPPEPPESPHEPEPHPAPRTDDPCDSASVQCVDDYDQCLIDGTYEAICAVKLSSCLADDGGMCVQTFKGCLLTAQDIDGCADGLTQCLLTGPACE